VILSQAEFESITQANCGAPHALLGMHPFKAKKSGGAALVVRAFLQGVDVCEVVDLADPKKRYPLERLSEDGLFEGVIDGRAEVFA
jgi:1,4-alpha-glucan branching enzyme